MTRRRDDRLRRSQRRSGGWVGRGVAPPPPHEPPWPRLGGFSRIPPLYRVTGPPPRPAVTRFSTVRPPLMRTVFTDTTFSRRRTPARGVSTLNRRPSPDLATRAIDWSSHRDRLWPELADIFPLQRTTTCARREIRREVLFAYRRLNGAGSRGVPKSKVRCIK